MCSRPSDDYQLIEKIKVTTDGLADKMSSNLEQVDAAIEGMVEGLEKGEKAIEMLFDLVSKDLQHLTQLIIDPAQLELYLASRALGNDINVVREMDILESSPCDFKFGEEEEDKLEQNVNEPIEIEEIEHLNKQDPDKQDLEDKQPQNSLLKSAQENVVRLKQTAHEYTSVLASLKQVEISAKNRMECTETKIREMVKEEMCSFENVLMELLKFHRGESGPQVLEEKITATCQSPLL